MSTFTNRHFISLILILANLSLYGQSISYVQPDLFSVCDTAEFQIQITNTEDAPLTNVNVTLVFSVGVEYSSGDACQTDNLAAPIFCLGDMAVNESQTITLFVRAACDALNTIDAGALFCNTIIVQHDDDTVAETADCYVIEKPLLVFTQISEVFMTGEKGQILERTITLRNTLDGPLSEFTFVDAHQDGMIVSSPQGTVVSNENNTFELLLSANDFAQIGDGDGLFEKEDGVLIITELIEITSCGIVAPLNSVSDISAIYGCYGAICQAEETVAYINFAPSSAAPNIVMTPTANAPECFCSNEGTQQVLKLVNNGNEVATNLAIDLTHLFYLGGFDVESFKIDSASVLTDLSPIQAPISNIEACDFPNNVAEIATLQIPILSAGDSIHIIWDSYFCDFAGCRSNYSWEYSLSYFKCCPPPDNFFINLDTIVAESENLDFVSNIEITEGIPNEQPLLTDGEELTYNYSLQTDLLLQDGGVFYLDIEVPCDLQLQDLQNFEACGQIPTTSNTATDTTVTYHLEYDLPLTCDFNLPVNLEFICSESCQEILCKDTIISSCPVSIQCSDPVLSSTDVQFLASFSTPNCPQECGVQFCKNQPINYECLNDIYCEEVISGYVNFDYDFYRLNGGLGDNNNDHIPDGNLDWSLANRYRAMAGDTLRSELRGQVNIDVSGTTFNYGRIQLDMGSEGLIFATNGEIFDKETGTVPIETTLRIFDQSANAYYECEPTLLPDPFYGFGYDISVNTLLGNACSIPPTFRYSQGDSIIFISDYEIKYNITAQEMSNLPPIAEIDFEPSVFLFNTPNPIEEDLFTCSCASYPIELTGYQYRIQEGSFGLLPCDTSEYGGGYLFRFELGEANFFPFEYRPLGTLTNWDLTFPPEIQMTESKITFLRYQDNSDIVNEETIFPTAINENTYNFNFADYQIPSLDEGYIFLFQHRFENDCNLSGNYPLITEATIEFEPNLPETEETLTLFSEENALRFEQPALNLDTLIACDISFDNKNRWTLNLQNESELSSENTAYNVWVYATSNSGLLIDIQLVHPNAGDIYPVENGIWQLGNIEPMVSFPLLLIAENQSCELENIQLHYGWNCDPYTSLTADPCFSQILPLKGLSPPGELSINEESPTGIFSLCDTISTFEMEIFNADLGAVCNPNVQIVLPNGFIIASSTTEISYPTGSPFMATNDPTLLNQNLAEWQINTLLPDVAENCLVGVNGSPANSFTMRFKAVTTCDFPSGSRLQYFTTGEQNCGELTNVSTELTEKIFIAGADAPYTTTINAPSQFINVACEETKSILVSLSTSQLTLLGDSIYIYLPNGVNYISNSYQPGNNANPIQPDISSNGNGFILRSEMLTNVNQIDFLFEISGLEALDCGAKFIQIQTLSHANALCLIDNQTCVVPVLTSDLTIPLIIDRPSFSINNFEVNTSFNNNIEYSLEVENTSSTTVDPTIIDFYSNGNLLHADTITFSIGTTEIGGNFDLENNNICDLQAIIDLNKHCACDVDESFISEIINYNISSIDTICSGESSEIGIPQLAGNNYSWTGNLENLDCSICPTTQFSHINESQNPLTFSYTLLGNNGSGCSIEYSSFDIVVLPSPNIISAETEICEGDCATIIASPASIYTWNCGDISQPGAQIQEVCPTSTTNYCVTITDNFGCVGEDETTIIVNPIPIANAGEDQSFCPEELPQLNAQIGEGYSYLWSPISSVNNAAISNPLVTTTEATNFEVTVFANGCQSTDEVNIDFGEEPITFVSSNVSSICSTSFAQLTATGGTNYDWVFEPSLSCIDCPNPIAEPNETTTFYVLVTNAADCFALDSITIDVTENEVLNNLEAVSICEGESYDYMGEILTNAGNYCDTFQISGGCDSIVCLPLVVFNAEDTILLNETICAGNNFTFEGNTYETAGQYCFDYQTGNGCDSIRCLNLSVQGEIIVEASPSDTTILQNESVNLNVSSGFQSYIWSPSEGLSCSDCPNPIASPTETTTYQVLITDENGCERSLNVTVAITTDCEISEVQVPNVFTPNDDGTNDAFSLVTTSKTLNTPTFEIYSRWGELIYSGSGETAIWDGNYKGKPAPADVYVYLIEAQCLGDDEIREFKGDVSLVR